VLGSVTVIYIFMYVCNNIQENEATQVYHNHIAVSSEIQLASCILSAPTPAKVTLATHGKPGRSDYLSKKASAENDWKEKQEV